MSSQTFESALKKLESIVEELESGGLPLEKSLKKFEEGVALSKFCSKKLDETEARVNQLIKDASDTPLEVRFDEDMGADNDVEP